MAPADDSEPEDKAPPKDEHGEPFKDFGFLQRAQAHKEAGNASFVKGSYKEAITEYDAALQLLLTIAEDRTIIIGLKKWDEVVVFRSLVHLNKSACHCKLGAWRDAVADASSCLLGNVPAETRCTHAHILANAKVPEVERRLPGPVRAKAWYRLSEGYLRLGYYFRASHAAAKAMKACEDEALKAQITRQSQRILAHAKREKQVQRRRFEGYWGKLEQEGGYVKRDLSKRGRTVSKWHGLEATEKLQHVQALDGSDGDSDPDFEGYVEERGTTPMLAWDVPSGQSLQGSGGAVLDRVWKQRQEEERARARAWDVQHGWGARLEAKRPAAGQEDDD